MAFALALGAGVAAEWTAGAAAAALWATAALSLAAFALLVARHRRVRASEAWHAELAGLNREALARLRRDWTGIPEPEEAAGPAPRDHPYASDLDLFGPASLRALLSTVATAPGASLLRGWLLEAADPRGRPPEPSAVRARQAAVRGLAPRLDLRDALAAHGRLSGTVEPRAVGRFLAWAEDVPWLPGRPVVRWGAWVLPALTWTLGAAHLAGVVEGAWWALTLLATLFLADRARPRVHAAFERAGAGEAELHRWASSMELLAELEGDAELEGLAAPFAGEEPDASTALRRLDRLVHLAETRHGLMHFFVQALFFWDAHVLGALERWKRRNGGHVRGWIEGLARADALSALAALRHDHPDWCFPELVVPGEDGPRDGAGSSAGAGASGAAGARASDAARPGPPAGGRWTLRAEGLGHPLLAPESCVRNDVTVGPPGTFLLVTGSNMSGKSTLLRAVGVAAVLGWAGGPACARRLRLPPVGVHTSIRVEDSLVRGVSQYMAELERVRQIVGSARRLSGATSGGGAVAADDGKGAHGGRSPEGTPGPSDATRRAGPSPGGAGPGTAPGGRRTDPPAGGEAREGARRSGPSPGDGADAPALPRRLLYLMDEPLRGTNEAERREAVRIILRTLLGLEAVGAVATHDLVLHRAEGLEEAARPVHFRGEVDEEGEGPALSFDYRLREGPATSTNALDLLRLAGLGPEGEEGPDGAKDG